MKRFTILFFALFFASFLQAGIIAVPLNETDHEKAGSVIVPQTNSKSDMSAFLALTPAKLEQMTGKKIGFKEKLALKIVQKRVKKQMQKGKKIDIHDQNQMLRYWLICWGIGLALSIFGIFVPFVSWIGWLFWLAGSVFFVLWLVAVLAN